MMIERGVHAARSELTRATTSTRSESGSSTGPTSARGSPSDSNPTRTAAGGPNEWVVAAGPVGGASSDDQVVAWFERHQESLKEALAEYGKFDWGELGMDITIEQRYMLPTMSHQRHMSANPTNPTLDKRGFESEEHWYAVVQATAQLSHGAVGHAVVARRQTRRDAEVLAARISGISGSTATVWGPNEMPQAYTIASEAGDMTFKAVSGGTVPDAAQMATLFAGKMAGATFGGGGQASGSSGGGDSGSSRKQNIRIRYRRRQAGESADASVADGAFTGAIVESNDPDSGSEAWLGRVRTELAQRNQWPLEETLIELDVSDGVHLGDELDSNDRADVERWNRFHRTETRVQKIPHHALRMLMGMSNLWDINFPAVCVRNNALYTHWAKVKREVFPGLAEAGWKVAGAITKIRNGEREVEVLFKVLDRFDEAGRAVVEHVLCSVKTLESAGSKTIFPRRRNVDALLMQPWAEKVGDIFMQGITNARAHARTHAHLLVKQIALPSYHGLSFTYSGIAHEPPLPTSNERNIHLRFPTDRGGCCGGQVGRCRGKLAANEGERRVGAHWASHDDAHQVA
jgi:hypothetical protein